MNDKIYYPAPISMAIAVGFAKYVVASGVGKYVFSPGHELPKETYEMLKHYLERNMPDSEIGLNMVYGYLDAYWDSVMLELESKYINGLCDITVGDKKYLTEIKKGKKKVTLIVRNAV